MEDKQITKEQQYWAYGCIPRCVEELSKRMSISIEQTEFSKMVEKASPMRFNQYGSIRLSDAIDLGRQFGLYTNADSLRDFKRMKELFMQDVKKVFLLTERSRNQEGELHHLYHCSLVLDFPTSESVAIWSPLQNGQAIESVMPKDEFENRLGHFVVLT